MKLFEMSVQDKMNAGLQATESNRKNKAGEPGEKNTMGKDSFLKLLVTELKHQDPTKPMEDKEFIAQMAQFSTLEQMSNINKEVNKLLASSAASQAYGILGREVDSFDAEKKKRVSGLVSSVFYKGDELMLKVGAEEVSMKNVHSVNVAPEKNVPVTVNVNSEGNKNGYAEPGRKDGNPATVNVIQ